MAIYIPRNENKHILTPSAMLREIVRCVHAFLEDNHLLTITDIQWKMAAHFHTKSAKQEIVQALQQFEMWKVCACWVTQQLTEEQNCMGVAFNFLTQDKEDRNDLLERIITGDESWIHFYEPERKSVSMVWKEKWKKCQKNSRMSCLLSNWC